MDEHHRFDVGIIGLGRVGLPLALAFARAGLRVMGFDRDAALLERLRRREMPFAETGCDELLRAHGPEVSDDLAGAAEARDLVITVGTPLMQNVEIDLASIRAVVDRLAPVLAAGQAVFLRSTVAPGTTEWVRRSLERRTPLRVGRDLALAFCPERLAEGRALEELRSLPQIVGARDPLSHQRAATLFGVLAPELLSTDYATAELTKLFNNISRYLHFAVANQLAVVATDHRVNPFEVWRLAAHGYPRNVLALPGLTAGTCLRKDFGMIAESTASLDLLMAAWRINEYMPRFLVEQARDRARIAGQKVCVLGATFKADCDDLRDSLVPKLIRWIEREHAREVTLHDPMFSPGADLEGHPNRALEDALRGADVVFVAVNHAAFRAGFDRLAAEVDDHAFFVDIWNVSGMERLVFANREYVASRRRGTEPLPFGSGQLASSVDLARA